MSDFGPNHSSSYHLLSHKSISKEMNKMELCPVCKKNELLEEGANALSRKDNETEICSDCGTAEAIEEMNNDFLRGKK